MKLLFILLLSIAVLVGTSPIQLYAQNDNGLTEILDVTSTSFPNIAVTFRSLDVHGSVIEGLSSASITLQENGNPVLDLRLTTSQSTPQILVFVIDTGFASTAMNDALRDLLREAAVTLRDNIDTVLVLEHSDSQPGRLLFAPETNVRRFTEWVSIYERPRTITNRSPLDSLESAIGWIEQLNGAGRSAATIIYAGQLIEAPARGDFDTRIVQLQQRAARLGSPIYSFNLGSDDGINAERVDRIASAPTGAYRISEGTDRSLLLQDFYALLARQRLTYTAQYRVPVVNPDTDTYDIMLQIGREIARQTYVKAVDLPVITIISPAAGTTFVRGAQLLPDEDDDATNDRWTFDISSIPVQASVSFPDGIIRDVTAAQLFVEGVPTLELARTTNLYYVWDISNIVERGSNPRTLQVSVRDEFGLVNTSASQTIEVIVDIPEGVVAPQITETVNVVVQTACEKDSGSTDCLRERLVVIGPWAGIGVLLVLLISQRRRIAKHAVAAGTQAVRIASFVRDSVIKPRSEAYAEFVVLEGPFHVGKVFPMHGQKITFGRDPTQTNIQLFPFERATTDRAEQCSISSKHCTVDYNIPNRQFTVTDHSRFGTFIKRTGQNETQQVPTETSVVLEDADEIILGIIGANGARLRFKIGSSLGIASSTRGRIPTNVNEASSMDSRHPTSVHGSSKVGRVPTDVNDQPGSQSIRTSEIRRSDNSMDEQSDPESSQETPEESSEFKYSRNQRGKKLTKL